MHKRRFNEFTLIFAIRPQGPLLIKSGQESGADPTLLDMNFVRTEHMQLGRTVYLPGSSLKGTLRSYAEKIARTLGEGVERQPPFSCNPLGRSAVIKRDDYYCGEYVRVQNGDAADNNGARNYALACAICRIFGHTSLASHIHISDAYPSNPTEPPQMEVIQRTNETEERDGVAIDRVSGAVAVGPFNLEVVTQGAFYASFSLHNFQLWQLGLLAIALRDLGQGRVPIGFGKSRGLGRVSVEYVRAEVAYPGRFKSNSGEYNFESRLYDAGHFLGKEAASYNFHQEKPLALPPGSMVRDDGDFGRVALAWEGDDGITELWRQCVPYWSRFVEAWRAEGAAHG